MQFAQLLLIGASFVVSSTAQIAFTTLPANVQANVPTKLTWAGSDPSQPVTITLKQGPPDNLVSIEIITGRATGNSYTWTPSKSLPNGNDYALQISQGPDDINYTGQFTFTGGSAVASSASSASSASTPSASSSSLISPASVTSSAAISSAVASLNNTVSSLVASVSNATVATTTAVAGTGAVGTAVGGSMGAATGTVMSRNTTMSSATLSRSKSASKTASTTSTESASTTAGSSAAATSSSSSSDAMGLASPLAFVLFAAGAIVYLG